MIKYADKEREKKLMKQKDYPKYNDYDLTWNYICIIIAWEYNSINQPSNDQTNTEDVRIQCNLLKINMYYVINYHKNKFLSGPKDLIHQQQS